MHHEAICADAIFGSFHCVASSVLHDNSNIGTATIHYVPCIREEIRSMPEHALMLIENTQVGIQNWLVYITVPKW